MGNEIKLLNNELLISTEAGTLNEILLAEAAAGKIVTLEGVAAIDTDRSVFGGSSVFTPDNTLDTDNTQTPDSDVWFLSGDKFTIDLWFNTRKNDWAYLTGQATDNDNGWGLIIRQGGNIIAFGFDDNDNWLLNMTGTVAFATNIWHHLAIVRDGPDETDWYIFLNGVEVSKHKTHGLWSANSPNYTSPLYIGGNPHTFMGRQLYGNIDEYRFSKGIARWTADFTPPTAPYVTDANTDLLLHFDGADGDTTTTDSSGKA